jgi:hypothetical protein
MPDFDWNDKYWGGQYDWSMRGEEWSEAWGTSEAQWFSSIFARIHRFLPAPSILEIAPGFGRWTNFLLPMCKTYVGIDLSEECVTACKNSFHNYPHAAFYKNDGRTLSAGRDHKYDLIFSFDSLVHVELDIIESYVEQCLQMLARDGVAFIHHSNLLELKDSPGYSHFRATSVSATLVMERIQQYGGKTLVQEKMNWGGDRLHDCLTLFARRDSRWPDKTVVLENPAFMEEATIIKQFHRHYGLSPLGSK